MANKKIGPNGESLRIPPDDKLLEKWISSCPKEAKESFDEIALLYGEAEVRKGGRWRVSLAIEDSEVEKEDGGSFNPFEFTSRKYPKLVDRV